MQPNENGFGLFDLNLIYNGIFSQNQNGIQMSSQFTNESSRSFYSKTVNQNDDFDYFGSKIQPQLQKSNSMVEFAKMIDSLSDDLHFSLSNQAKNMNVEQIENELKQSFTTPDICLFQSDPEVPNLDQIEPKVKSGRPKNKKTNKVSDMVNIGGRLVKRGSEDHEQALARVRKNVINCRNRKLKVKLDGAPFCLYCSSCFDTDRGLKTHQEKCPAKNLTATCGTCQGVFKKYGLKNHQKTCNQMSRHHENLDLSFLAQSLPMELLENF